MSDGLIFRVPRADAEQLRAIAAAVVGAPGWSTGGSLLWDVGTLPALRPLGTFQDVSALDLSGDFGHIFSRRAELRWRRRDDGAYDLLILGEPPLALDDAYHAEELKGPWHVRPVTILQQQGTDESQPRPPIAARIYEAPNGAAQFVRYQEVKR